MGERERERGTEGEREREFEQTVDNQDCQGIKSIMKENRNGKGQSVEGVYVQFQT